MLHIETFTLGRFRGLDDVTLTGLGRVNLLVGGNNSGKTSILEALAVYAAPVDIAKWATIAMKRESPRSFLGQSDSLSSVEAIRWLFPQQEIGPEDQNNVLKLMLTSNGLWPIHSLSLSSETVRGMPPFDSYGKGKHTVYRSDEIEFGAAINGHVSYHSDVTKESGIFTFSQTIWASQRIRGDLNRKSFRTQTNLLPSLPCSLMTPYSHRNERGQLQDFSKSVESGENDLLIDLIRFVDVDIRNLYIVTREPRGRPILFVDHAKAGRVPSSVLGDGFRRTLSLALALFEAKGGLLLIDEIESALHVSVLEKVFSWLVDAAVQYDVQIFATTHSLEAVGALTATASDDHRDLLAAYHLPGSESSDRRVKRYSSDMLNRIVRDRGLDIR